MNSALLHYFNGGGIHPGDRVRYKGESGHIAFVSDGESGEFGSGYAEYTGHEAGVMFCSDDDELTFIPEPNEDLEFVPAVSSLW